MSDLSRRWTVQEQVLDEGQVSLELDYRAFHAINRLIPLKLSHAS
jgi:hypothetical protein